jgi:hypothetical protein
VAKAFSRAPRFGCLGLRGVVRVARPSLSYCSPIRGAGTPHWMFSRITSGGTTMQLTRRRLSILGALVALALSLAGCPGLSSGATGPACPTGDWTLTSGVVSGSVSTPIGPATVTFDGNGIKWATATDTTWSLSADQKLNITASSSLGTFVGTAQVKGEASGTYSASGSTYSFNVSTLSGNVTYKGTLNGSPVSGTLGLKDSADLRKMVTLEGGATISCGTDATVTVTLPEFKLTLKR